MLDEFCVDDLYDVKTSIPSKKDWALSRGLMIWGMTVNEKQRSDNTGDFVEKFYFFGMERPFINSKALWQKHA